MPVSTYSFLRRVLVVDAAISGVTALLMLAGAGFLGGLLAIPATLLRFAGLSLIPFVAYLFFLVKRGTLSPASVWPVIVLNVAWVVASGLLLLSSQIQPNALGHGFVIVQAIAVAVFAELQYVGLRRERREIHTPQGMTGRA